MFSVTPRDFPIIHYIRVLPPALCKYSLMPLGDETPIGDTYGCCTASWVNNRIVSGRYLFAAVSWRTENFPEAYGIYIYKYPKCSYMSMYWYNITNYILDHRWLPIEHIIIHLLEDPPATAHFSVEEKSQRKLTIASEITVRHASVYSHLVVSQFASQ